MSNFKLPPEQQAIIDEELARVQRRIDAFEKEAQKAGVHHEIPEETVTDKLQDAEEKVDDTVQAAEQAMDTTMEKIEKYSGIFERLSQKAIRLWTTLQPILRSVMKLMNRKR